MDKNIILLGLGETGEPLEKIELEAGNNVSVIEIDYNTAYSDKEYDVMHVCIPYSEKFVEIVRNRALNYTPKLIIIHATVVPGTTEKIGKILNVPIVHSPIRGLHPNLYGGLKTFIKGVGGTEKDAAEALKHLSSIGIRCRWMGKAKATELAKILDTTYYGWNILFAKLVNEMCIEHGVDYNEVYTEYNKQYNKGYTLLGKPEVVRPVLTPPKGIIGGHCVTQNFELLPEGKLKKVVKDLNKE